MIAIYGSLFPLVHLGQGAGEADVRTRVGRNPPGGPSFTEITRRSYHFKQGWAILCFRKLPLVAEGGGGLREDARGCGWVLYPTPP